MSDTATNIFSLTPEDLTMWLTDRGQPAFRARQVLEWVYKKRVDDFGRMTNLSKDLRAALDDELLVGTAKVVKSRRSEDGRTTKHVLELVDGETVEGVLMVDSKRTALCLSSQTGCAMGCRFCSTGASGPGRNLSGAEIVEQAWLLGREGDGFTHVVFMGMGEPLRNPEGVQFAMAALTDERRFGIGARRITLSTCGLVGALRELKTWPVHPQLAISVNSPFEEERRRLMPGCRKHPLASVLAAADGYVESTGRRLTFEYVQLPRENDSERHARELAALAKRHGARVNLIPFNPTPGSPFRAPTADESERFRNLLQAAHAPVSVRYRRGRDIGAACGQLRGKTRRKTEKPA